MILSDADEVPPFRIENESLVSVLYHQVGVAMVSELQPQSKVAYAWDDLKKEQVQCHSLVSILYLKAL